MSAETWQPGQYVTSERQAEEMAAAAMRGMGYPDARETPVGPDAGIDVAATGAIAQVKWRGAQTGRSDLQRLVGARGHRDDLALFFFVGSGYSTHAIEYATEMGIAAFVFDPLGTLTPMSPAAERALSGAGRTAPNAAAEAPAPPSRWSLWWRRWWLEAVTVFAWFGVPYMLVQWARGEQDGPGGALFYLVVAVVGTVVLKRRYQRARQ